MLLLCILVVAVRRAPLLSDRTWSDESYILTGAHGLAHAPLPGWFRSTDLRGASFADVLRALAARDAYPPLAYTVAYFSAKAADPVFAPRWIFVGTTAACATAILIGARGRGLRGALVATVLAFCASGVARTGADVKWSAVAPALMTACTLALTAALERGGRRRWLVYGVLLLACLNTHYFMLSAVPAHALFVAWFRRDALKAFAATALAALLLCLPWYVWALPQQVAYVDGFFAGLDPSGAVPSWRTPLSATVWIVWLGYNLLTVFGFEPSSVRAAFVLPFAVLVLGSILAVLRRAPGPVRRLAVLSLLQMVIAFLAQSAYAMHFGHTAMLTWAYFVPWSSPLLLSWGLAGMAGGWASRAAVVALSSWTLAHALFLPPDEERYRESLDHRREVAEWIDRNGTESTVLVHRSDTEARLLSLYYRGPHAQTVCPEACAVPEHADALLVVSPFSGRDLPIGGSWSPVARERLGRSSVVAYRRTSPVAAGDSP